MPDISRMTGNWVALLAFGIFVVGATMMYFRIPESTGIAIGGMTGFFALIQVDGRSKNG